MSKLEVLVTTMFQNDERKYEQMNLQTDAVIANQTDCDALKTSIIDGHKVRLVSTSTRGLSRNRNIAIAHSSQHADFFIFADDDLVFCDAYEEMVIKEFEKHPYADAIKFNLHDLSEIRKINMRKIEHFEKATRLNMSSSSVNGLAIRSDVLKRYNLNFHEYFGAGTENYCGEDTIFIMRMIDTKIRLYRSPVDIAGINQEDSTWFTKRDEKYFTTLGMVIGTIYPVLSRLIAIRSAYKFSKRNDVELSFWKILKCYYYGVKEHV